MRMNFHRKLPIPQDVKKEYSLTEKMKQVKNLLDESIRAVFDGSSDKFILIIGPCSADHKEPVLEYISRLRLVEDKVKDKIIIIRVFIPISRVQRVKGIRVCFISPTPKPHQIC